MLVGAFGFDVQIHVSGIAQALEEMEEHLGRHIAHLFALEFRIPDEPRTSTEIKSYAAKTIVHRERVAVAFNATLVAERLVQGFAQGNTGIFYCVMFVYIKITFDADSQVYAAMFANLFKHVVEESQ